MKTKLKCLLDVHQSHENFVVGYASLLNQQQIYWKQRGTIRWVKHGDEGTKFFHANATIKQRRNLITALQDSNGQPQFDHHIKAGLLWEAYKDRLGTSVVNDGE
jgi:hypothetical protein